MLSFDTKEEALRLHPSLEDYFLAKVRIRRAPSSCEPWGRALGQAGVWLSVVRRMWMETFLSSLSNELFKLRRRKKYLVFLILGCAICVISALRVLLVNYLTDGSVDPAAVLGGSCPPTSPLSC